MIMALQYRAQPTLIRHRRLITSQPESMSFAVLRESAYGTNSPFSRCTKFVGYWGEAAAPANRYGYVLLMMAFGILGYALRRGGYDVAPLFLAFVLGGLFEQNLRQGVIIGFGDPLACPISAGMLFAAVVALVVSAVWRVEERRGEQQLLRHL